MFYTYARYARIAAHIFGESFCRRRIWIVDWFVTLNNKLGGDLTKIRATSELMIETWTACGMDMKHVEFVWASEKKNLSFPNLLG